MTHKIWVLYSKTSSDNIGQSMYHGPIHFCMCFSFQLDSLPSCPNLTTNNDRPFHNYFHDEHSLGAVILKVVYLLLVFFFVRFTVGSKMSISASVCMFRARLTSRKRVELCVKGRVKFYLALYWWRRWTAEALACSFCSDDTGCDTCFHTCVKICQKLDENK